MGLSFEDLFKGIRVAEGAPGTTAKGELSGELKGHNLVSLARKLRTITCSENEMKILGQIQRFVVWQGRYPLPTNAEEHASSYALDDPAEHRMEHALWRRLRDHLATRGWHQDSEGKRYPLILEGEKVTIGKLG